MAGWVGAIRKRITETAAVIQQPTGSKTPPPEAAEALKAALGLCLDTAKVREELSGLRGDEADERLARTEVRLWVMLAAQYGSLQREGGSAQSFFDWLDRLDRGAAASQAA